VERLWDFLKQPFPINVRELGRIISEREEQYEKHSSPNDVIEIETSIWERQMQ
jgi:hypothetical protein